jgi:hypothetical protein
MAGNFTPSQLLKIQLKAEAMWAGGQQNADLAPNSEAARAVIANQTASIRPLESREKDNTVVINWVKSCDIEAEDCETNCTIDEPELDTAGKEYTLDTCKKTGFSIDEETLRTNTYTLEEVAARGIAKSLRVLDEFWAQKVLAKLKTFAGINVAPSPYTWDPVTQQTTVTGADYNRKMVAYLLKTGIMNKIRDMYFIDNGELFVDWTNARFDAGNGEGKGDRTRIDALNMYFDMFNFPAAGIDDTTFLIGKDAVALTTRNRHTDTPQVIGGKVQQTRYTVASPTLPGVKYDVFYTVDCKTVGGKAHIVDAWRFETQGLVALNPEACPVSVDVEGVPTDFTPTGVLSFKKGA